MRSFIIVVQLGLLVSFFNFNSFAFEVSLPSYQSLYLVDGDSVNLKMRLKGIDTPEIEQLCQISRRRQVDCGRLAQQHLQQLLKNTSGKLVVNLLGFDNYQRALVSIYKGGTNIAQQMVLDGFAFSYGDYPLEQKQAQNNKVGFWAFFKPPQQPKLWRRTHPRKWY